MWIYLPISLVEVKTRFLLLAQLMILVVGENISFALILKMWAYFP